MKLIIVSAFVLVALSALVHTAAAYPQLLDLQFENQPQDVQFEEEPSNLGIRQKRVTCDLLSLSVLSIELNHAACAANCIRLGRSGGACNNGVCICRN